MTSAAPFNVKADSRLSDDTLLVSPLSIDPNAIRGTAVALADDDETYLFAILTETGASELQRSESSASGYEAVALPSGAGATEIQAFIDSTQTLHAFWVSGAAVMHASRPLDGSWSTADTLTAANAIGIGRVPMTETWIAYGVGSDGNLVLYLYSATTQSWSGYSLEMSQGLLGCTSLSIEFVESTAFTLFAAVNGSLNMWSGTWSNNGGTINPPATPINVSGKNNAVTQVFFTYQHQNSSMVVFGDKESKLYTTINFSTSFQHIPKARIVTGSGFVTDNNALIHFYGADKNGHLWVLHQKKWNDDGTADWASMFPLDRDITYVAAPARRGKHVSLLAICMDTTLHFLTMRPSMQTPGRSPWVRLPVRSHSHKQDPMRINRYRTSLTLTDANGIPCPHAPVTVTPTSAIALEWDGKTVFATPDKPAAMKTDVTGVITFSQPAVSLNSVSFHVTGDNIPEKVAVVPHYYLHQQLSGKDEIFTGSTKVPAVSPSTLQNATVPNLNGGSAILAPKASNNAQLALAAAQGINAATTRAASKSPEALLAGGKEPLFSESFSLVLNGPNPQFNLINSREALAAELASLDQPESIWSDIADFFEDIWHAIVQGVMSVVSWVVDTVENVVSIVVQFADTIISTIKNLAIEGFEAVAGFVHGVFAWIGAEVDKVLDWLKDLFDWGDMWNTMENFYAYLQGGVTNIGPLISGSLPDVDTFFKDLKADVHSAFEQARVGLKGSSMSGPKNAGRLIKDSSSQAPPGDFPGSTTQTNWLFSKITAYLPGYDFLKQIAPTTIPADLENDIYNAWKSSKISTDFKKTLKPIEDLFKSFEDHPKDLWDHAVSDLLKILEDIVDVFLDGLDALATTAIEIMATASSTLLTMMEAPLNDIPILSWLWTHVLVPSGTQEQLTLGKLVCLIMAVPVTLACKLVTGSAPFPTAQDVSNGIFEAPQPVQYYFSIFLAFVDTFNDMTHMFPSTGINPLFVLMNLVDAIANAIELGLYCPTGQFTSSINWSSLSKGQKYSYGTWIGYWLPVLGDAFCGAINAFLGGAGKDPGNMVTYASQIWDVITGAVTCGTGIAGAVISEGDFNDIFSAAVFPLPWAASFLCFPAVVNSSEKITVIVKIVIDWIGDYDFSGPGWNVALPQLKTT